MSIYDTVRKHVHKLASLRNTDPFVTEMDLLLYELSEFGELDEAQVLEMLTVSGLFTPGANANVVADRFIGMLIDIREEAI